MGVELARLSLDLTADVLHEWREVNERADAIFQALPCETQEAIRGQHSDWSSLVPTLVNVDPELRHVGLALLGDLLVSLSHPHGILEGYERPSEAELMDEVEELQAEVHRLRSALDMICAIGREVTESPPDTRPEASSADPR